MVNDLRIAARLLAKSRGFAIAALTALTLGIAANATVFTILNGIFLRDLPFADPDRIVGIETRRVENQAVETDGLSYPDLQDLRSGARLFDGLAGVAGTTMTVTDEEYGATRHSGAYISANGFALLGQRPALGRDFRADDDRPGAAPVVVLGHAIWQSRYGGDARVLGRFVRVNGTAATIVGVMPDGFGFPQVAELWQPLGQWVDPAMTRRDARRMEAFGKRRAEVTNEQAQAELDAIMGGLGRTFPETNGGVRTAVIPYRETMIGDPVRGVFATLLGAVVFLLAIACANVANLLMARGAGRTREIALRLSLGASRGQIVRQLLAECFVLAVAAGGLGLILAAAAVRLFAISVLETNPPYFLQFPIEARVVAFVAIVCLGTAVVFGLAPALHSSRVRIAGALNDAGYGATGTPRARRWAGSLVVLQLTLALVLLAAAGVLTRNVVSRLTFDPGIDTNGIVTMKLELPARTYGTVDGRRSFYERLDARLAAVPGVRATFAGWAPLEGGASRRVSVDGRPDAPSRETQPRATTVPVGPRYFETLGIPAIEGRTLTGPDSRPGQLVAVVNEQFAATRLAGLQPLGSRIRLSSRRGPDATEWFTVVGVVPNVRQEEADPRQVEEVVYVPYAADPLALATIVVHSNLGTGAVVAAVRHEVATVDPDLPLFAVGLLGEAIDEELRLMRVIVSMLAVFAVAAIALAAIGLYALTAAAAAQRTREIGVRVALGARAADVWWLVARRAVVQTSLGLLLGAAGTAVVGRLLQGIFESVDGYDPVTLGGVGAVMVLVGAVASWMPARRALRIDPAQTLRN